VIKNKTKKGFTGIEILVVIVVLVLLAGGYWLWQNKSSTTPVQLLTPTTKPTTKPTTTPSEPDSSVPSQSYLPEDNWHTVSISNLGISTCLPPKWELGTGNYPSNYMEIFFARDAQYRPRATSIESFPYSSGSVVTKYLETKYKYEPDLISKATSKNISINNKSAFKVSIPSSEDFVVFSLNKNIYAIEAGYDEMVDDSKDKFQKNIYTIVGCIK